MEVRGQQQAQRVVDASFADASPSHHCPCGPKYSLCLSRRRVTAVVQEQLSTLSQVLREGGLDDEEEDFDNETGCSAGNEVDGSDVADTA